MATITVNGLGSGLDYNTWIEELVAVKQSKIDAVNKQISGFKTKESNLSSLKTNYSDLLTKIQTLTDTLSSDSVFNKKTATSSSDAVTAKVDSKASAQSVKVGVTSLATSTVAKSASTVASYVDGTTAISDIAEGAITEGTFSVYVGGVKHSWSITSGETLDDIKNNLNGVTYNRGTEETPDIVQAVTADIVDGKLSIQGANGATVTVGSSSDSSNFSKVMSLVKNPDNSYSSSKAIFRTDTSAALTSASAGFAGGLVTEGTFTIGNAEFTIDSSTTLDGLIKKINDNEDAGVNAYWDSNAGKLVLTSTDEGATNINIEAGTSNFTDIMGLTSGGGLADNSQELGTNAVLTINGTTITSASNTITSDVSGITGLTLTLNDETTSDATINIAGDTSAAVDAITNFVSAYNMAISNTETDTSSKGNLHGESLLNMLESKVRSTAGSAISFDNTYKTLASIGITTGAVTTDMNADVKQLKIDKDKLTAALEADPDAVLKMFTGDDALKTNGVLSKMSTTLENALNATSGYFTKQNNAYENQIDRLNDKTAKMTKDLEKYQTNLEAKFQAMDKLIAAFQKSGSIFDSYFNNKNNKNNN